MPLVLLFQLFTARWTCIAFVTVGAAIRYPARPGGMTVGRPLVFNKT
jgi:hypothetical protein